jgi:flagellar basal body P-ring formation protein FlgA
MPRTIMLALLLALGSPAEAQVTGAITPTTPVLKSKVTVAGDLVRIGDLIDDAGPAANVPIFRAPDLGTTGTVPTERVLEAVRAHAVIGVDTRGAAEVAVSRPSRAITAEDIERRIARALAGRNGLGSAANIAVTFDRDIRTLHVEPDATEDLQVARLRHDPRTTRFDADLELPGNGAGRRPFVRVSGTAVETVEVATINRPLERGNVLRASDVTIERRPKGEATGNFIVSAEGAVGLAARRPIRTGQLLRDGDLMRPELVQRNETVTIVYGAPGLLLTMRGKALESGAEGDTVSVLNMQSNRTVHGKVSAYGRVDVTTATPISAGSVIASQASDRSGAQRRGVE